VYLERDQRGDREKGPQSQTNTGNVLKMGAKKDMEKRIIARRNYSQPGILVVFYSAAFLGCSVFMKYHAASIMPIRPMTPTSP
jgi:hypothetical protein